MNDLLKPGQVVVIPVGFSSLEDAFKFYHAGRMESAYPGDAFVVLAYPPSIVLPKYAAKKEAWCEVVDGKGRIGIVYPAKYLQIVQQEP